MVKMGPENGSLILTRHYSEVEQQSRRDNGRLDKEMDVMFLSKPVVDKLLKVSDDILATATLKKSGYDEACFEKNLGHGIVLRSSIGSPYITLQRVLNESFSLTSAAHTREVVFQCITLLEMELCKLIDVSKQEFPKMVNLLDKWRNSKEGSENSMNAINM